LLCHFRTKRCALNRLKKFLYQIMLFFWTACCAVLMVVQTRAMAGTGLAPDWLLGFVFCGTVFAYNARVPTLWRKAGALVFTVPLLYCFWRLTLPLQCSILAPGLLWGVYLGLPGRLGLRDRPWLIPFAVSLAWGFVTVWLPLPANDWLSWAGVFLGRAAFVFGLALGYDLIDRGEDRTQGLRTLAGEMGVQSTLRVANIAFAFSGLMGLAHFGLSLPLFRLLPVLWLTLLFSAWLIRWQLERFGPRQWQKITIDAMLVLQAAGVILVLHN
jgi:4-hydroxybenzoate polyprenyltransferase